MKGNLFKTTKNKSLGYEPKEYARYNRSRDTYLEKIETQKKILIEIFKNDDFKKLKQYRKIILNYFLEDSNTRCNSEMNSQWVTRNIIECDAEMCFYYLKNQLSVNGFELFIPIKFQEFFNKIERVKKIETLKNIINERKCNVG